MNQDNPFGDNYIDDDKTILRPTPGGRRLRPSVTYPTQHADPVPADFSENMRSACAKATHNPFIGAAVTLLSIVPQLRNSTTCADITGLRGRIIEEIKHFELSLKQQGIATEQVHAARYALCTLLDETVLNTPWGCNSLWSTQSLLIYFHKEAWGGEKFFLILKNCMQQVGMHLNLLELLYFCLSLGFEGRYRVEDHGASRLAEIRDNACQIIQRQRGDVDRNLSLHWQGIKNKRNTLSQLIPFWVIGSTAAFILMSIFLGFLYAVNSASNPVLAKLYTLKDSLAAQPVMAAQANPVLSTAQTAQLDGLAGFLKPEVDRGEVQVLNRNGKIVVRLLSKGFFTSGSDKITLKYYPLLDRVSQALNTVSERILVVGHTDSSPMFTAKFPSNWDLSKARALAVAEVLTNNKKIKATIVSEGRADSQPMVANDSPEHRAMNRRVEIIL